MALTLGDNFSYQGAKPLDARLKYDTLAAMKAVADSTMYDGCLAYCVATDKTYQWKSTNTVDTDTGKWREYSSGGGHDIKNNGVAVTERGVMNFTDFDIADDSTNEETDVKAHRLTSSELSDICTPLPSAVSDMPVLFDEREAEYIIGWYVLANGTKKPLYQKTISGKTASAINTWKTIGTIENLDIGFITNGYLFNGNYIPVNYGGYCSAVVISSNGQINHSTDNSGNLNKDIYITVVYTKTTDTPV